MHTTGSRQSQQLIQQSSAVLPDDAGLLLLNGQRQIVAQNPLCATWFGEVVEGQTRFTESWLASLGIHLSDRNYRKLSVDDLFQTDQQPRYLGLAFSKETRWVRLAIQNLNDHTETLTALVMVDVTDLIQDIQKLQRQADDADTRDFTTKLYNRRYAMERLEQMHQHAKRYNSLFTIAMIDIDHFKRINDTFGHNYGDEVLHRLSSLVRKSFRETDLCARFGGEEFMIIMPETETKDAVQSLDRLRQQVSELKWDQMQRPITISSGVIQWQPNKSIEQLIFLADQRLATAKKAGRNQVCGDLV